MGIEGTISYTFRVHRRPMLPLVIQEPLRRPRPPAGHSRLSRTGRCHSSPGARVEDPLKAAKAHVMAWHHEPVKLLARNLQEGYAAVG